MTIRTFIFCDICNPQCVRSIEFRRAPRDGERSGRRISDGRAWFEGSVNLAVSQGWLITENSHICPACRTLHRSE